MRQIERLLTLYGESHQNRTNIAIHAVAVPAIYLVSLGLLWSLPVPEILTQTDVTWAHILVLPVLYYYFRLSGPIGAAMTLLTIGCFTVIELIALSPIAVWQCCLFLFVVMWILQFVGHKIEGKKPSFFDDIRFLLVGPAWWWTHWLKRLNIGY
ncbi:DUF962 domain-containing protein [Alteromonas sp. 14N.309.X.WAT.G.H12]|uniref:Mpo1 family 2-hydroxy fatty acid dioxygenase n=1 Tax=Alteromonas sp. 14N.309.X.WAT.G.H12 TaxID=3120824 RepID=UPI002FD48548